MHSHPVVICRATRGLTLALAGLLAGISALPAQVVSNLQSFTNRVPVGDPLTTATDGAEGPKGIATADFNGDGKPDLAAGNLDGTITVLMGQGDGKFSAPVHIQTGADELRAVLAVDLNGDNKPDLAAASPLDGKMMIYLNNGSGGFGAQRLLPAWRGVRNLAAGDFDGDGIRDLAAAGPGMGLRHYRGTGGGNFEIMGDLPRLSPAGADIPRPVYALRALRSRDGLRDDLLLTHAESAALYVLSTQPVNRSTEPPVDPVTLPAWKSEALAVVISEVQLNNSSTLLDADGQAQPWVELLNKSAAPVNLGGWKLNNTKTDSVLPAVTIAPGGFLVVFLSGKGGVLGGRIHTSFKLTDKHPSLKLSTPGGETSHTLPIGAHTTADISTGLAMDVNRVVWFDIPSPGAANNAGFTNADDAVNSDAVTTLTITPRFPTAAQAVTVKVKTPFQHSGGTTLRAVWFSTSGGLSEEHHLLQRLPNGDFSTTLAAGVFTGNTPHRVLAKYIATASEVEFGQEIHPGLDDESASTLAPSRPGRLLPVASVPSPKVRAFEVGTIRQQIGAGLPSDLVFADDVCGLLRVHRSAPTAQRFQPWASQDLQVRGSPRDVKLADLDGDGWLDALVVLRAMDLALAFRNDNGILRPTGEYPTGRSPREAVMADFSGDGRPDAAVINRYSADISILTTAPGLPGLVSLDQVYPVDGEVTGVLVDDFNNDGRDDVMQLHRASGEVSVRYANPNGSLKAPEFLRMPGQRPSSLASADINNDGVLDTLTADLGWGGASGTISVSVSKPGGGFTQSTIPGVGPMFAISVDDFDNDGKKDLVAGLFDCRVTFFKGNGAGGFTVARTLPFVYESRVMVTADFDQDGDIDVAGAGYSGKVVVLENQGSLLTGPFGRTEYPTPGQGYYGTERIGLTFLNADLDPDLIIGSGHGCMVYLGGPGMSFTFSESISNSTPSFNVSDVVTLDLDGNGSLEMVVSCRQASCVNILTQSAPGGPFTLISQANVPSSRYLATGDLDGDGKPDLVGTGDALWTVLSSRPPQIAPPASTETTRPITSGVLINEILSHNTGTPVPTDGGRKTDFVELYNSTEAPVAIGGWKLKVESTQDGLPFNNTFTLPSGALIPSHGHSVVLFSVAVTTNPAYTGFTLPSEPGTVSLLKPDNTIADSTRTPASLDNVSWSRFRDGHPNFRADGIPSPGLSNLDNGSVPPEIKLTAPSPATMLPGQPLNFTAKGKDDSGIVSLSLLWKPVASSAEAQRVVLYDDGMHADGPAVDGFFAGQLAPGLPAGTDVQFYLEATDLSGNTVRLPDSAELTGPGRTPQAWTFSLGTPPTLAITAISPANTSLRDESGGTADYIQVRNTGTAPVNMAGVQLAKSPLSSASSTYSFPAQLTLAPGAVATVFADQATADGAMHAPFTLDSNGDEIALLALQPSGARQWIHSLTVPAPGLFTQGALRKIPGSSRWAYFDGLPSPGSVISYDEQGRPAPSAWVQTTAGAPYRLEGGTQEPGLAIVWQEMETFTGDGTLRSFTHLDGIYTQLRILPVLPAPAPPTVKIMPSGGTLSFYIQSAAASSVTVFSDVVDRGPVAFGWNTATTSSGNSSFIVPHIPATGRLAIVYRIRAYNPAGETWSPPAVYVVSSGPEWYFNASALIGQTVTGATLQAAWPLAPQPRSVRFAYGTADSFDNLAAWPFSAPASPSLTNGNVYRASVAGLTPGVEYFGRFVATLLDGSTYVSGERITFHAATVPENIMRNLRITEIMYHPAPPTAAEALRGLIEDDFEWLELFNDSPAPRDLSGCWWSGISLDFPATGGPVLQPGQRGIIAAHPHAFAARYGAGIPLFAWTLHPFRTGKLSNSGEALNLYAADGTTLLSSSYSDFDYTDDGGGYSLDSEGTPAGQAASWITSRISGGTPGQAAVPLANWTLAIWKEQTFTLSQRADALISGDNADPDRDGLTNAQEYLFGTPPLTWSPQPLQIKQVVDTSGARAMQLTVSVNPRAASGLVLYEAMPAGASSWTTSAPFYYNGQATPGTTLQLAPDGTLQCVRTVAAPASRTLYRLRSNP